MKTLKRLKFMEEGGFRNPTETPTMQQLLL